MTSAGLACLEKFDNSDSYFIALDSDFLLPLHGGHRKNCYHIDARCEESRLLMILCRLDARCDLINAGPRLFILANWRSMTVR
jgi:hypothetical protein